MPNNAVRAPVDSIKTVTLQEMEHMNALLQV